MDNSATIPLQGESPRVSSHSIGQRGKADETFFRFIARNRANRRLLIIALAATLLQFLVFKLLYPFPDFFSDSYSYIYAAYAHLDVSIWPIGYSKFLAAFHGLTHSDTSLVAFQYFFLELAGLYFYFSVIYFNHAARTMRIVLFLFLFFNPLFLYLSNYVSSDPLFAGLSLVWFTELLWIVNQPRLYQVFTQGLLLFLAITVRNNAYIYPVIAIAAFFLSRQQLCVKLAGSLLGPSLILPFILHTRAVSKEMTGTAQYSLFTGWMLANNALYMRDKIEVDRAELPSTACRELDSLSGEFFKKEGAKADYRVTLNAYPENYFVKNSASPLRKYLFSHYLITDYNSTVISWGKASPVFSAYGSYLIKKNPLSYLHYFVLLDVGHYLLPSLEKLEVYNLNMDEVPGIVQSWFDYKSGAVTAFSNTLQGAVLLFYPALFLLLNLYFIGSIAWSVFAMSLKSVPKKVKSTLLLAGIFWLFNFFFCIFVTMVVLRYQIFPMIVLVAFALLLKESIENDVVHPAPKTINT